MNVNPFIELIVSALDVYKYVLIFQVIASWLLYFNVINPRNRVINMFISAADALTEPLLRKIRKFLPNLGGIDISVIIVFLLINFIQSALINYFYTMHL